MYHYRALKPSDLDFFKEMFYESLFVAPGESPFPKSIIERAELARYYKDWGRPNDCGILVETEKELVGAIWCRFFSKENKGYGFVSEHMPELGIALRENYRNQGLGKELINRIKQQLKAQGTKAISLSVSQQNRALNLYKRCGFIIHKIDGPAVIMYCEL